MQFAYNIVSEYGLLPLFAMWLVKIDLHISKGHVKVTNRPALINLENTNLKIGA